jgi:hypothetical protein
MSRPLLEVADLIRSAGTAFIERGVSILLCKRPGFVFGDGCAREGAASLPSPSDVERFCALMTQLSPGPAFVPATES